MAELPRYRPLGVGIPSVPTVDFVATGRAQGAVYKGLGKSLDVMMDHVYKKQVEQAKITGAEMGATQPESVLERLRDENIAGMTITDRAAYEAAVESLGLKVEVAARKKMGEISLLAEQENFTPQQLEQELNSQIDWTNAPNKGSLAFGVAILTDPALDDKITYWGRYFKQKII